MQSPAVRIAEVGDGAPTGSYKVWLAVELNAGGLQFLAGFVHVIHAESDVVDADILLASDAVNLEERLVGAGQLQFGGSAMMGRE